MRQDEWVYREMNRREITFVITAVLLVAVFLAVYPTAKQSDSARQAVANWSAVRDDPSEVLSISWAGPPCYPTARKGTWIETNLETKFNTDFRPIFMDWSSSQAQRPLMFCSGEVPDVCWDGDPLPLQRYIRHGLVLEVPYDVIIKYAPTYARMLNQVGLEGWLYSGFRGHNYGLPTFNVHGSFSCPGMWRMDWLRKVGITKVPDSIEEMHEAMMRIHRSDVSGAGTGSVSGMCPAIHWSVTFVDVFSAYKLLPADFILRDGKVVWGGVQSEARQVLAVLHQWYTEGLIDPDFVSGTTGTNLADDKFINGKTAYLYNYKSWPDYDLTNYGSFYSRMRSLDPKAELAPSAGLMGSDGKRHARSWGGSGNIVWFGAQVASHPEKVIRVLRMFEACVTDSQLFVESRLGRRGLHWEWSAPRGVYLLPPYDQPNADSRNLIAVRDLQGIFGFYSCFSAPAEFVRPLLQAGQAQFDWQYGSPEWCLPNAIGKSDAVESAGEYLGDLWEYQMTNYVQFVRGSRPLAEFDDFVKEWNQRGGEQVTREANARYQELRTIAKLVGADDPGEDR